jgi:hypothetical protein
VNGIYKDYIFRYERLNDQEIFGSWVGLF